MKVEEILEEMENILLESGRVPFTNKRLVEEDDMARLIDELRDAMPSQLVEAGRKDEERNLALAWMNRAKTLLATERTADALADIGKSVVAYERLVAEGRPHLAGSLAHALLVRGECRSKSGDHTGGAGDRDRRVRADRGGRRRVDLRVAVHSAHGVEDILADLVQRLHQIVGQHQLHRVEDRVDLIISAHPDDRRGDEVMLLRPGRRHRHRV